MAYASWPIGLPAPLVAGYGETLSLALLRAPVDRGPPLQRAITDALPRPIDAQVIMSRSQWGTFKTFVVTTLSGGALPFQWLDIDQSTTVTLRFRDSPSMRAEAPDLLVVSLPLEILP